MTAIDGRLYVDGQRTACPPGLQDAAVAQLRAKSHEFRDEGIALLTPLKHRNQRARP